MRLPSFIGLAVLALVLDQVTKTAALAMLDHHVPVPVFPGFNLTLGFNTGASFGMFDNTMADRPMVMAALTGALAIFLTWLGLRARLPLERAGFALIVGGASGNIIDRLRQGAVTDFLDFYWRGWHWPAFNGADAAIFLGAVAILLAGMKRPQKTGASVG